jgi:hypothetical protein
MNIVGVLDAVWRDLKYGARLPRLNPGFAIVAFLSLALGSGWDCDARSSRRRWRSRSCSSSTRCSW